MIEVNNMKTKKELLNFIWKQQNEVTDIYVSPFWETHDYRTNYLRGYWRAMEHVKQYLKEEVFIPKKLQELIT